VSGFGCTAHVLRLCVLCVLARVYGRPVRGPKPESPTPAQIAIELLDGFGALAHQHSQRHCAERGPDVNSDQAFVALPGVLVDVVLRQSAIKEVAQRRIGPSRTEGVSLGKQLRPQLLGLAFGSRSGVPPQPLTGDRVCACGHAYLVSGTVLSDAAAAPCAPLFRLVRAGHASAVDPFRGQIGGKTAPRVCPSRYNAQKYWWS
jgi:hypothetical protein